MYLTEQLISGIYYIWRRLFQSAMSGDALPPMIDGTVKQSFCFTSITERWPKIITKIIDQMHRYHPEAIKQYGEEGGVDVKLIISKISEMRYRIVTDKPLLDVTSDAPDADMWNMHLHVFRNQRGESNVTWFKLPWLFTECFMYAKLCEFFQSSKHLKNFDYFGTEKQRSYVEGMVHMLAISTELNANFDKELTIEDTRRILLKLLQVSLWGNKCDLSLSGGDQHSMSATIFQELDKLHSNILEDNLVETCDKFLLNPPTFGEKRVDIILDNAGLEVFTDICLADFMISKKIADKVVFHGKAFPWYVSDTTASDFNWVIQQLVDSEDTQLKTTGNRWRAYQNEKRFEFQAHPFWTQCFPYCDMRERAPELYDELRAAYLLIFKGDLNYRKLVSDRYWPYTTSFKRALCGFAPTSLLSLRTLKAETVAGLSRRAVDRVEAKFGVGNKQWMVTGDYAVAQLSINSK